MLDGHQSMEIIQDLRENSLEPDSQNAAVVMSTEYPSVNPVDVYSYCMEQLTSCLMEINANSSSPDASSGYQSFNLSARTRDVSHEGSFFSKEVQDDLEFWSLMRDDDVDLQSASPPVCYFVVG